MTTGMIIAYCLGFIGLVTFILEYRVYKRDKAIAELKAIVEKVMQDSDNVRSNANKLINDYNILVDILYEEIGSKKADMEFVIRRESLRQSDLDGDGWK